MKIPSIKGALPPSCQRWARHQSVMTLNIIQGQKMDEWFVLVLIVETQTLIKMKKYTVLTFPLTMTSNLIAKALTRVRQSVPFSILKYFANLYRQNHYNKKCERITSMFNFVDYFHIYTHIYSLHKLVDPPPLFQRTLIFTDKRQQCLFNHFHAP